MTLDKYRLRSDFLGTQVITRNSGQRLGIVSQVWVDVDQREVVAVGLRENMMSSLVSAPLQIMPLSSIRQIGDVILVDDDTVLDDEVNLAPYSTLVNCEVITETGEPLGRVRGFKFDVTNGRLETIVVASFGLPQIPDQVISTYELSMDEVVSSGPDRLIVFEGAEEKMVQLSVGLLERLGIGSAPWERATESEYIMPVSTSNQLPSGVQAPAEFTKARTPATKERWSEDDWGEPELVEEPVARVQAAEAYRAASLDSNWDEPATAAPPPTYEVRDADYQEVTEEPWSEESAEEPYTPTPIHIPQKKKVTEYEEELDY
jgi:sporulation protein YlmC with PRC-barrel domain